MGYFEGGASSARPHTTAVNWKMLKRGGGRAGPLPTLLSLLQHLIFTKSLKRKVKICITLKRGLE